MLQLDNGTDLEATHFLSPDVDGVEAVFVALKGTYEVRDNELVPAEEPAELVLDDEWQGEPGKSGLVRAADVGLPKPGTDVVVTGFAHAPPGRRTSFVDVSVSAGGMQRWVRVWGDRFWRSDGSATDAEPFEMMPLVWERAFGGSSEEGEPPDSVPANPVGIGFRTGGSEPPVGWPLPNLEDPYAPIMSWDDRPKPACTAPVAAHWEPRRSRAGTYDERWQRERAPFLPEDFDRRFLQTAPDGQHTERPLDPGEWIEIQGATRRERLVFRLPDAAPLVRVRVGGTIEEARPSLATVHVETEGERVSLVWRGGVRTGRRTTKVRDVVVVTTP